jgi:cytochrome c556
MSQQEKNIMADTELKHAMERTAETSALMNVNSARKTQMEYDLLKTELPEAMAKMKVWMNAGDFKAYSDAFFDSIGKMTSTAKGFGKAPSVNKYYNHTHDRSTNHYHR